MNALHRAATAQAAPRPPLLSEYRNHDTLFSSARSQLHARGVLQALTRPADDGLAVKAQQLLDGLARAGGHLPLVGAVPFDRSAPSCLWVPEQAVFAAGQARHRGVSSGLPTPTPAAIAVTAHPAPRRYMDNVATALQRIRDGAVEKVVLSRSLRIEANVDAPQLLGQLLARVPDGYTFALDLAAAGGPPACLLGASPELLLQKRGGRVLSNPLAGSTPRAADPDEDRARAQALLLSAKDRYEHALVVDAVADALTPHCRELQVPHEPSLLATPTMWHLSTRVQGELHDPAASSLQLALALHPTPAVCGHPAAPARALIDELEGYDRGLFTGLVGWCDGHGDGEWAVTIRCALVEEHAATVYAGAGVVTGSLPQAELDETSAKLRTMLGAMGLAHVLDMPATEVPA